MKFSYSAINDEGKEIQGVLDATSPKAAQNILLEQGYLPAKISKIKADDAAGPSVSILQIGARVKVTDVLLFTKQLNTMLRAGISITNSLEVIKEQSENPLLKKTLVTISREISEGSTLTGAFRKHPKVFPPLYCSLLHAGESSGSLSEVLDRVAYILEHENRVREDVKAALAYPKIVVLALAIAFFVLLTGVIPKFVGVFNSAGLELPLPTKVCIWMYEALKAYWYLLLGGVISLIFLLRMYFQTSFGALHRDKTLLKIPIIGPLFIKTAMSRFASILSILMASGVNILESLKIISDTIGNAAITYEFNKIKNHMEEGRGIARPLRLAKHFPPMVVNMIAIGEESGSLETMLQEIAKHYDEEVEYAVKGLSEAIGPILIVGLTVVVGFFALAIFLPMWDLTKMVK